MNWKHVRLGTFLLLSCWAIGTGIRFTLKYLRGTHVYVLNLFDTCFDIMGLLILGILGLVIVFVELHPISS